MTLASKKPALLLLPRSMESTLPNRQWLDKASTWQRQGGKAYIAAPAGALTADYARCGIAHTVLPLGVGLLPTNLAAGFNRLAFFTPQHQPPHQGFLLY